MYCSIFSKVSGFLSYYVQNCLGIAISSLSPGFCSAVLDGFVTIYAMYFKIRTIEAVLGVGLVITLGIIEQNSPFWKKRDETT